MSKVYLLPLSVFLLFQITFIATYIAAVIQGHVVPTIPYISDAATYSPESCVFGQMVNMGCVLLGLTVYTRYRQVQAVCEQHDNVKKQIGRLNKNGLLAGFGSCLGISIVGNFQETNVRMVHFFGAFLAFGLGTVFFWFQAVTTYYIQPHVGTIYKAHLRLGLSVLCTIGFIVVAITGIISHILFNGPNPRKWLPSDGGWEFHVASSIAEWIVATAFCFYILTFTDEFRYIEFDHPPMCFIEYDGERIVYAENESLNINDSSPIITSITTHPVLS